MKKRILLFLLLAVSMASFSQTNMYWFNPFVFNSQMMVNNEAIAQDTAGQLWFLGFDGVNSQIHIINQDGTVDHPVTNYNGFLDYISFFFDSRNDIWLNEQGRWSRFSNGNWSALALPGGRSGYNYSSSVFPDKYGSDFIVTQYIDSLVDSVFVTKFDGATYQTTYVNGLGVPFNNSTVVAQFAMCDNSGAFFLNCKSYGFMKYDQGSWTHVPLYTDSFAFPVLTDKSNNFYIQDNNLQYIIRMHNGILDSIQYPPGLVNNIYDEFTYTIGPDSNLWMITAYYGFYDLMPNGVWTYVPSPGFEYWYSNNTGMPFPAIFDRRGKMWTTGGGSAPPHVIGVYSFTPFNSIKGRVFYDTDADGVADNTEPGFTAMNIVQSTNGYYANTDTAGQYAVVYIDSAIGHVVTATPPPYYHLTTPGSYTVGAGTSLCCYDFGVLADGPIQDLQITSSSFMFIPGRFSATWLNYQNTGTVSVSDTITYTFDSLLMYQSASPAPTIVSGRTLRWAYQGLAPFESGTISIDFIVDSTATMGDTLRSFAAIYPLASDTTPADNVYTDVAAVMSSFDPNEKEVSPSTGTQPGQELTYTVHFQNTGNAPAANITVLDTLDANLNPASFRLLGSSHPVKASLQGKGVLNFTFSNIMLPDSATDPDHSIGFVKFAVNITSPLKYNATSVSNVANIYFDFNPAVETNTATSTFRSGVGIVPVSAISGATLRLIPNPANDEVIVETGEYAIGSRLMLYDAIGSLLLDQKTEKANTRISLHEFASGIYIVRIVTPDVKAEMSKLIKR